MLKLLFIPGWSYSDDFWHPLQKALEPEYETYTYVETLKSMFPVVVIAHSYGMMRWLQAQRPNVVGWVCINGFTRFSATDDFPDGVPTRTIDRMLSKAEATGGISVEQAMLKVVNEFRAGCAGQALSGPLETHAQERLRRELTDMRDGDQRQALVTLNRPGLVLADRRDSVVTEAMSQALFDSGNHNGELVWHEQPHAAPHFLPESAPDWCAEQIKTFLAKIVVD